jgi:hypothetical protein
MKKIAEDLIMLMLSAHKIIQVKVREFRCKNNKNEERVFQEEQVKLIVVKRVTKFGVKTLTMEVHNQMIFHKVIRKTQHRYQV